MRIRVGYEMIYDFPQPTPMIMVLGIHFTRGPMRSLPSGLQLKRSVTFTAKIRVSMPKVCDGDWRPRTHKSRLASNG
jgi:hypothetical protein